MIDGGNMKQVVLGTAGHIDHGKTSFVKALTGIDTDRLKEEKERGITIELGFAYLKLGPDQLVGIVDVPGHERFIRHMVAGATGIDLVALIIAADEGVMPQTKEHLEICQLLGIGYGIVVITKIDMVDPEWLQLVKEDIKANLGGTFLESAPMVEVSSVTGEGIEQFKVVLKEMIQKIPPKKTGHVFRLPVDRVFTIKGFGTVVTGTTISGSISVGDEVTVYPKELSAKVRAIQVHGRDVKEVLAGVRTALNLQGLEKTIVNRGNVVATKDSLKPSLSLDCILNLLPSSPFVLKNRADVRFHTGTSELIGKIILLDRPKLEPGDTCLVHIRLQEPTVALRGDKFVLRSYSPMRTIGGGTILNPCPPERRKLKRINMEHLRALSGSEPERIVESCIKEGGFDAIELKDLVFYSNLDPSTVQRITSELIERKIIVGLYNTKGPFLHTKFLSKAKENILEMVSDYHKKNPIKPGISKEELKSKSYLSNSLGFFELVLKDLVADELIVIERDIVRNRNFEIKLKPEEEQLRNDLLRFYRESGGLAPTTREVKEKFPSENIDDLLELLIREGHLVKIKDDLLFHKKAVDEIENKLIQYLTQNQSINAAKFKDLTGLSRKYAIPLLEYFDRIQVTMRVGDERMARKK